jgi:hypothetical protein
VLAGQTRGVGEGSGDELSCSSSAVPFAGPLPQTLTIIDNGREYREVVTVVFSRAHDRASLSPSVEVDNV